MVNTQFTVIVDDTCDRRTDLGTRPHCQQTKRTMVRATATPRTISRTPPTATADDSVLLRAERSGEGSGRLYTATFSVSDAAGNTRLAAVDVVVPHNVQSPRRILTDSGRSTVLPNEIMYMVPGVSLWGKRALGVCRSGGE